MISIITPVYNGERFIESCIKNVISQDFSDMEHIIVDGGSTDRTVEIVKHYAAANPHIRWISEKDKGQSDAMNKGIAMAKGEIIGFLNVDDFYEPGILKRVDRVFEQLPCPSFVVANCNVLNSMNEVTHVNQPDNLDPTYIFFRKAPFPCNPSAYFYHKSLHERTGLYEINDHYSMDLRFLLKAIQEAKVVKYINETWGNFREIEGSKTFSSARSGELNPRIDRVLAEHRKSLPLLTQVNLNLRYFYLFILKVNLRRVKLLKKLWNIAKGDRSKM